MSLVSSKICKLCGEGFRGTPFPEEVYCAKCFVKTCDVPDDTEEQFLKLVAEVHGSELSCIPKQPLPASSFVPMIEDMLNHKKRLDVLEKDTEQNSMTTKEKNRVKREIQRLRKEKDVMDGIMEGIKAKMMHIALMTSVSKQSAVDSPSKARVAESPAKSRVSDSPSKTRTPNFSESVTDGPSKLRTSISTPPALKAPANTPTATPPLPTRATKPSEPVLHTPFITPANSVEQRSPPRSPLKQTQLPSAATPSTPVTKSGNESPVKRTALKFEAAAKRRTNSVSFAKVLSPSKPRGAEVNNNLTIAVTSTSSSEEDLFDETRENGHTGTGLTRSNSVRDRIKAFEAIQRSASTGSYDRRKYNGVSKGQRSMSTMKGINI